MKNCSVALQNLIQSGVPLFIADCYTITLNDGTVLRWTGFDQDLSYGGNTWDADGPLVKRNAIRLSRGLEVSTLSLTISTGETVQLYGIPLQLAAHNGAFDNARVMVERFFMATPGDTTPGSIVLFEGNVAGVDPSVTDVVLGVKDDLERLNVKMPKNLFMPKCGHSLYGAGCGVSKAAFTVTGTATGTPTSLVIPSARGEAAGYFNLGVLAFTSGVCAGSRRAVKDFAGGQFTLNMPLPDVPAAGDTFTVYPGCDHTKATCQAKFNNLNRFRGFPYVPRNVMAR